MKLGKSYGKINMENILSISNWEISNGKKYHIFKNLTDNQKNIIKKFAKKYNYTYICIQGRNKIKLCKETT